MGNANCAARRACRASTSVADVSACRIVLAPCSATGLSPNGTAHDIKRWEMSAEVVLELLKCRRNNISFKTL
eukprot:2327254-Lingulodinium_polyedra.AAC.1